MFTSKSADPLPDFHPSSPLRVPWWRWGWAHHSLELGCQAQRKYHDEWSDRACKYVRALRRLDNPEHPRLSRLDPEIFAACRLARGDLRTIFEIELRVLSRQSYVQIAECCGEAPETLIAFEMLFYDMRRLLDVERAVLDRIHYSRVLPFTRADLENMIRSLVYRCGEKMIEPTLRFYDERFHPSRVEGIPDPAPHLTKQFAEEVEFYIWSIDPASSSGLLKLQVLERRADLSMQLASSAALFRPVLGSLLPEFRFESPAPHITSDPTAGSTSSGSSQHALHQEPERTEARPKIVRAG